MDVVNVMNLVELLKDRCGKLNIPNETEYPTTRGLLMHAAILIEERILNEKPGTVGYFFLHSPFVYSTKIRIIRNNEIVVNTIDFGALIGKLSDDIFDLEIDRIQLNEFQPFPNSDVLVPVIEIVVN